MEQNSKNYQAEFMIFTFKFKIMLLEVYYREAMQLQCLAPTLYVNLITMSIFGVHVIICAYNIDDLYHTRRIMHMHA